RKARKAKDEDSIICSGMELEKKVPDQLSVFFLSQGDQTAESVMGRLTDFISAAQQSIAFAIYDMRLSDSLKQMLAGALQDRARRGVRIRICFDGDKPLNPNPSIGQD